MTILRLTRDALVVVAFVLVWDLALETGEHWFGAQVVSAFTWGHFGLHWLRRKGREGRLNGTNTARQDALLLAFAGPGAWLLYPVAVVLLRLKTVRAHQR